MCPALTNPHLKFQGFDLNTYVSVKDVGYTGVVHEPNEDYTIKETATSHVIFVDRSSYEQDTSFKEKLNNSMEKCR